MSAGVEADLRAMVNLPKAIRATLPLTQDRLYHEKRTCLKTAP